MEANSENPKKGWLTAAQGTNVSEVQVNGIYAFICFGLLQVLKLFGFLWFFHNTKLIWEDDFNQFCLMRHVFCFLWRTCANYEHKSTSFLCLLIFSVIDFDLAIQGKCQGVKFVSTVFYMTVEEICIFIWWNEKLFSFEFSMVQ